MAEDHWKPGQVLAHRFRLETRLGEGGMGSIWRAEHLVLAAPVALKLIDPEIAEDEDATARFMREAQSAASLRSPHVVQILDHGFAEQYEKRTGKKGEFFTTNGDVFPVGTSKLKPFAPTSPNGSRSFPRKNLTKGSPEWNHYYIRAINGEIRLWVNGEEVSGGKDAEPRSGYLCLESEGSPIEVRAIRIRELP